MMKQTTCPECDGCGYVSKSEILGCENGIVSARTWNETCHRCNRTGLIEVPMTNADRIRAMSDEELAVFMSECNAFGERAEASQRLPWLQQPCEGGADSE